MLLISILAIHIFMSGCLHRETVVLFRFLFALTVDDFVEGRGGVKIFLLRDGWLKADERWLNGVRNASTGDRRASISGERWGPIQKMLRSVFLKRGTFMVWNGNWCRFLKWTYLASRARRLSRIFAKGETLSSSFYSLVYRRPKGGDSMN